MKAKVLRCSSVPNVISMVAPRGLMVESGRLRDEEAAEEEENDDSPTKKKPMRLEGRKFLLTRWEFAVAFSVFLVFSIGLICIYSTMPAAQYGKIKLPRTIADLRILK